jgi:hypothetical protein
MDARVAGSCFGYGVRSDLHFHYLRGGGGEELAVFVASNGDAAWTPTEAPLIEWVINRDGGFLARLYPDDDGRFRLWVADSGWYVVDPHVPSVAVPQDANVVKREERLWGIPAAICFLARGDLALHAAAVEVEGRSLLLAAPGTFGKTTLATAFQRAGHRVLSEDLACVRVAGEPSVIPGPAMLRVRPDVAEALELVFGRRVEAGDDRAHIAIDRDHAGDSEPVPLRAIVFLDESESELSLVRVDPAAGLRNLWTLNFTLPTADDRARAFRSVADLAHAVPIWMLRRPFRLDRLEETIAYVVSEA